MPSRTTARSVRATDGRIRTDTNGGSRASPGRTSYSDYPVLACADAVADTTAEAPPDCLNPADPLYEQLDRANVIDRLPTVLAGTVKLLGSPLAAEPVAAPPYVVVTNVGPIMRATLEERRLVITIEAFRVKKGRERNRDEAGDTPCYVRTASTPADVLTVEIHEQQ